MEIKKHLFLGAALLLLAAACTNDNMVQDGNTPNREPGTEGNLTAFVIEDNSPEAKAAVTRTTGQYSGSGLDFYWTEDDPPVGKQGGDRHARPAEKQEERYR